MSKNLNGLQILKADRLRLRNGSDTEHPITVNGVQLGVQHLDTGRLVFDGDKVLYHDALTGNRYHILHENSTIDVKFQEADEVDESQQHKILEGQIIPAGKNAKKQASPAPFAFIDTTGRLGSDNLWSSMFSPNIMGYTDQDKPNTYAQGLLPAGSAEHGGLFLRKDGQWGSPSVYTGSVSETLLSLGDTPSTYQDQLGKFLRVSYAEGGSVVFHTITTSDVAEGTHLYYTDARVETKIVEKTGDRSLQTLSVQSTVTARDFIADSDARLKERITCLTPTDALNTVLVLQPKSYRFKGQHGKRYGLVAQEVQEVLPDIVKGSPSKLGINYMELVPFLIGSIQRLEARVKHLEQRLVYG